MLIELNTNTNYHETEDFLRSYIGIKLVLIIFELAILFIVFLADD